MAFDTNGELVATAWSAGDGTVPDECAIVDGVADLARCAPGSDHMTLPIQRQVMQMVWRIINSNVNVRSLHSASELMKVESSSVGARSLQPSEDRATFDRRNHTIVDLPDPIDLRRLAGLPVQDKGGVSSAGRPRRPTAPSDRGGTSSRVPQVRSDHYSNVPPTPPHRRLRVYSFDPLLATDPESLGMESIVLRLEWDEESADGAKLQPGPVGEYLEVVDYDPASGCFYPPVDLNHPNLLAQDGMPLNESDPRFHQQMVYAVCMATITIFERALGRTVLWSPHLPRSENGSVDREQIRRRPGGEFVRRLRIYPHALREPNAYYDPQRKALLFGYFPARTEAGSKVLPGGLVFTCLSYDVVAHETTHALLDGMHRHLIEASNPDVLAFHEAFADIVALFQHFSHPEVLNRQVALAAGKLQNETLLGQLAQQFGEAMGMHKSLRNYLGELEPVPGGAAQWKPIKPDPELYRSKTEPHELGAILVAAMFTAVLTIYRNRTRDLLRIASGGSGLVPPGDLHPDLVKRLASEAAKAASHLLIMAIRALDYVPPIDLNFGDYLRAIITGDSDLVSEDSRFYRVAIVDAFRQWGIYPRYVRNLSVESLNWAPPEDASLKLEMELFREIMAVGSGNLRLDRGDLHELQRTFMVRMHRWMRELFEQSPQVAREWGLSVDDQTPRSIALDKGAQGDGQGKKLPKFEVHSVRRCRRIGPDEQERIDVIVVVLQRRDGYLNPAHQAIADGGGQPPVKPDFVLRGGATLIVDPRAGRIRYAIRKSIVSDARMESAREFHSRSGSLGLRANYAGVHADANPFPMLHAGD